MNAVTSIYTNTYIWLYECVRKAKHKAMLVTKELAEVNCKGLIAELHMSLTIKFLGLTIKCYQF